MATSLLLCTNCNSRQPNTGYKWCDHCYQQQSQVYHGSCMRCGNPPNPGYPLCELCFRNKTNLGRNNCLICSTTPAEPNMDLCQNCWGSMNNTAGNQFMSNPGIPARIQFPLTLPPHPMHPLLSTVSNVLCAKCKLHPRNLGYELCETCFQREQMAVPRPNPSYLNGFTQHMLPFPMPPHLPMAYANYTYRPGFQSIESSPDSQDEDAKTLLKKSSSYVNKKVVKKKPLQPTEATEHHCMCPLCYSDASRTDLFYCVHCFESVVVDDSICNGCRMRIK